MDGARSRGTVAVLLLGAAACWWLVAGRASSMPAGPGPMGLGLGSFLILWSAMMAAMTLPAVAPVAGLYAASVAAASRGASRTARIAGLVLGYLAVWSAIGALAYPATLSGGWLARSHASLSPWAASVIFAATAAYQLSPLRSRCLAHCRAPFALLFRMTAGTTGRLRDLRAGAVHGAICSACCIPLMACLLALGMMSLAWMLALTIVISAERTTRNGIWVTRGAAVALVVLAVITPLHPEIVAGLHMPPAPMGM